MKRKALLFGVTLALIVSLLPLAGVSARESSPSSSEAAATVLKKTIKNKGSIYDSGYLTARYVQKIQWWYNGSRVKAYAATMKGTILYWIGDWFYLGYALVSTSGGVGHKSYYRWTEGQFNSSCWGFNFYVEIEQQVYADGTSWGNVWFYPFETR
jgi:hypothetical protein